MEITVLFFARARELAATDTVSIELPESAHVSDAIGVLGQRFPELGPLLGSCRTAVDEEFAACEAPLRDGCVLAIIPPVSGG